jgi:hypothetical protein
LDKKEELGGFTGWSDADVEDVLRKTQEARYEPSKQVVEVSHLRQSILAWDTPWLSWAVYNVIVPILGFEPALNMFHANIAPGISLRRIPIPHMPRAIPYLDELPVRPLSARAKLRGRLAFSAVMGVLLWVAVKGMRIPLAEMGAWTEGGPAMQRAFVSSARWNKVLNIIVSLFSYVIAGDQPAPRAQVVYFLGQVLMPLLVWTTEGYRIGNSGTILSLPSLFTCSMQLFGIGKVAPVYMLLNAWFGMEISAGRFIGREVAQSLVPALTLGYVIPSILMVLPNPDVKTWQDMVLFWQFSPALFATLVFGFSGILQWRSKRLLAAAKEQMPARGEEKDDASYDHRVGPKHKDDHELYERYRDTDVRDLLSVYKFAFAITTTTHLATLAYAAFRSDMSLVAMFSVPDFRLAEWDLPGVAAKVATFFKYDMTVFELSSIAHSLYSTWELRRLGYVSTWAAVKAAAALTVGSVIVGPGAAWAGLWYWREKVLIGLSTFNK